MKKNILQTLLLLLVLLLAAGLGIRKEIRTAEKKQAQQEAEEEAEQDADVVTLRIYDKNVSGKTFTDPVAQTIMKKTGVNIEIVSAGDNPEDELDLMLNQRNYPDIVLMSQGDMVNRYIESGAFISLDILIKKYGQNIEEMYGDILEKSRYTDANIYWLANWYGADYDASAGVLIRKDLLEQIAGKERAESNEPFTMSEYTELLRKFKEKFPQLQGEDSIALELDNDAENYVTTLEGMYGMKTYVQDDEGNLLYAQASEGYKEALLYLNSLYREGLLDKEWIISKTERWEEKLAGGYVFSTWASYWDTDSVNKELAAKYGDNAQFYCYKVVADDLTADQTTYNARNSLGWDAIGITDNCENPEAAIKVLDFLASEEGQYLMLWGVEGQTWDEENGKHVPKQSFLDNWQKNEAAAKAGTGTRNWTWVIKNGLGSDGTPYDLTTKYASSELTEFANASFSSTDYWDTAIYSGLEPSINQDLGLKWIKVTEIYDDSYKEIVCAGSAQEAEFLYEKMLEDMKLAGLEECEEYITKQYQKRLARWN